MPTPKEAIEIRKKLFDITKANKAVLSHPTVEQSMRIIGRTYLPDEDKISCPPINSKKVTKIADRMLHEKFPSLNRIIQQADFKEIMLVQANAIYQNMSDKQLIKALNDCSRTIDILKVPVKHNNSVNRDGNAILHTLTKKDDDFLRRLPIIASHIELNGPIDGLYALAYMHEIFHLLPQRFRGTIEDYYQQEVLPIFIEKVTALETDPSEKLLSTYETMYNRSMQKHIDAINAGIISTDEREYQYVISTLYANCLFDRYYNETPIGRGHMLSQVQSILNGQKSLGQVLKDESIDLSTSEVVIATEHSIEKSLIKK